MSQFRPTERTRLRRLPDRGIFEQAQVAAILDEGFICHVGFAVDGQPYVIPTIRPQPWTGDVPADFKAKLLRAIVGFEIEITRVEGKFKFGQNRPHKDQLQVVQQLEQSADPVARALGEMTKQQLEEQSS